MVLVLFQYCFSTVYGQIIEDAKTQWSFSGNLIIQTLDCTEIEDVAYKELYVHGIDSIAKYTLIDSWRNNLQLHEMTIILEADVYICTLVFKDRQYRSEPLAIPK